MRPSFTRPRRRFAPSEKNRGERSAERRIQPRSAQHQTDVAACRCPGADARRRQVRAVCATYLLRGALAFRRTAAALAGTFTSRLSSRPCFLGLGPNGRYPSFPVPAQRKHLAPRSSCRREWCPEPPGSGLRNRAQAPRPAPQTGSHPERAPRV